MKFYFPLNATGYYLHFIQSYLSVTNHFRITAYLYIFVLFHKIPILLPPPPYPNGSIFIWAVQLWKFHLGLVLSFNSLWMLRALSLCQLLVTFSREVGSSYKGVVKGEFKGLLLLFRMFSCTKMCAVLNTYYPRDLWLSNNLEVKYFLSYINFRGKTSSYQHRTQTSYWPWC